MFSSCKVSKLFGILQKSQIHGILSCIHSTNITEHLLHTTPVLLPRKPHGQRSLVGYSPWGCKRVRHALGTKTTAATYYTLLQTLGICEGQNRHRSLPQECFLLP